MIRVAGKVALVTGGAKGIGAANAQQLAAEGVRALITDLQDEAGERLGQTPDARVFIRHDVRDEQHNPPLSPIRSPYLAASISWSTRPVLFGLRQ